jgi:hypothetical protein
MPEPQTMGYKCRPRCKHNRQVTEFPVDRRRRDGRWRWCKPCARTDWHERGAPLRAQRKLQQRVERENRSRLEGLRFYSHRKLAGQFASVPPSSRPEAQRIYSEGIAKDRKAGIPLTRQRRALRLANAASNACRVGSHHGRSFVARMNAHKRWKRERERKSAEQQAAVQIPSQPTGVCHRPLTRL